MEEMEVEMEENATVMDRSLQPTAQEKSRPRTVHENPNWLFSLKTNFADQVVNTCSVRTTTAVSNNEDVELLKEHADIKTELLRSVCSKIRSTLAGVRMPSKVYFCVLVPT